MVFIESVAAPCWSSGMTTLLRKWNSFALNMPLFIHFGTMFAREGYLAFTVNPISKVSNGYGTQRT